MTDRAPEDMLPEADEQPAAAARIRRNPALQYSFLCDADLQYWLRIPGVPLTARADQLAATAGHEFPFDFTPLLRADRHPKPIIHEAGGPPHYMLWLEGFAPAKIRWRDFRGRQIGPALDALPGTPRIALQFLIDALTAGEWPAGLSRVDGVDWPF